MNPKKLLLATMLLCAGSIIAQAQGLVGAPVDPRYGQCNDVNGCASKAVTTQGTMVLNAIIIALRIAHF